MQIQKHELRQIQKLKITPQLLQAIKIMVLPLQELRATIREELERNPALEIVEEKNTESFEEAFNEQEEDYFENSSDSGYIRQGSKDPDAKQKFMEGVLTRPETLHEHLLWQLRLLHIPTDWRKIGELLINNLDENGFHLEAPENLVKKEELPILEKLLPIIQNFDPVGVCTSNYREALQVQARLKKDEFPLAEKIIRDYLSQIEKGKIKEIAKALQVKQEEIERTVGFIKTLEPLPGRNYSSEQPTYVIPDVRVKMVEGEFVMVLNDEEIPILGINPFFKKLKDEEQQKKEIKNFVNTKINEANWFIKSIKQRNENLLKVCRAIVEFQRDFFRKGPQYLVPLTLKDISSEIGVHEATISRLTTGKYIQTEWGIFELKYFFTNSISGPGSQGSRFSKEGVKQIIKELIQKEPKNLSDKQIVEVLANRGIKIARRTVSKYRKELGIFSSFKRKKD